VRPIPIRSYATIVAVAISLFVLVQSTLAFSNNSHAAYTSAKDYDIQKNCTADPSKRPTSIEYLTHFNCGRVSQGENGQTTREFTLVIEENQNITISNAGHYFDALDI
jgi:hypothetical protein